MTRFVFHTALFVVLGLIHSPLRVAHASTTPADSVRVLLQMSLEQRQHDRLLSAGKLGYGASPEFSVRVVYFHPADLEPHPDIDAKLHSFIVYVQSFYADEMERHGYGRKTFRVETDKAGSAVVRRVTGKFANSHYRKPDALREVDAEINVKLGKSDNVVYLIWVDLDDPEPGEFSQVGGNAYGNSFGGTARIIATDFRWTTTPRHLFVRTWTVIAHELGHAFGLPHDFRDDRYVMSYGDYVLINRLSPCAANWLDAHRYFNTSHSYQNRPATIEMLPPVLALPPNTIRLRFRVADPDGIRQARLVSDTIDPTRQQSGDKVLECKTLNGDSETEEIEFTTNSLAARSEYVGLSIIDVRGNFEHRRFKIDVASLRPPTDVVSIPDQKLEASIKKNINKDQGSTITQTDLLDLTTLNAPNISIADLTGLAYAKNLIYVDLRRNQITDITPLAGSTRLRSLLISKNQIRDITPLSRLTELSELWLSDNRIRDLKPLSGLTNLTNLLISDNQVGDIEPLTELSKLRGLHLRRNQISNVSPLTGLVNLEHLYLRGNPIDDTSPLRELLRQNPLVQIDIHVPRLALVKISGDEQQGPAGSKLVDPFVVEVRDLYDNPLPDASVTFVVTSGGGTLSEENIVTDSNGRASTILTLGSLPGNNAVAVTLADGNPETFTAEGLVTPDFDGDGTVGFSDFVQFAAQFGSSEGDEGYDARFDLDGNGVIGFSDFVMFAGAFGNGT